MEKCSWCSPGLEGKWLCFKLETSFEFLVIFHQLFTSTYILVCNTARHVASLCSWSVRFVGLLFNWACNGSMKCWSIRELIQTKCFCITRGQSELYSIRVEDIPKHMNVQKHLLFSFRVDIFILVQYFWVGLFYMNTPRLFMSSLIHFRL